MRRRLTAAALAAACLLVPTGFASAHSSITAIRPAQGATLGAAPPAIVVTYAEALLSVEEAMVTVDGRDVAGAPRLAPGDARRVIIPVTGSTPGGYRASWIVVAADGHAVSGEALFQVSSTGALVTTIRAAGAAAAAAGGDLARLVR